MSEHIHKGHLHFVKEEAGKAVPCCSPRELELESERDQLREEVKRLELMVKIGKDEYSQVDQYVKEQYKAYDQTINRLKSELEAWVFYRNNFVANLEIGRNHWKSIAGKMAEALKLSVGWMEPIMDGFSVRDKQRNGEPSSRVVVLDKAKAALALYNASRGEEGKK